MFKIVPERTFDHPVEVPEPDGRGGHRWLRFRLTFRAMGRKAWGRLQRELQALREEEGLSDEERDTRELGLTMRFVVGWPEGEVGDADGRPVAYSRESLAELLDMEGVPERVGLAYAEALHGAAREERRRGNSRRP